MAFYVGQKVVCINDETSPGEPGPYVVKGQIYTISGIHEWSDPVHGGTCLLFEELPVEHHENWSDGYKAEHFRPVVEKSTDTGMAILRKLLTDTKIKEKA